MNRSITLLVSPLLLAVALVACSGASGAPGVASLDDPSPDPSASSSASIDPEEARLAFSRCMREQGVELPDMPAGGRGAVRAGRIGAAQDEDFQKAMEACREHLQGVMGERGPELSQEQRDAMLEFARCMREHGIDMPDPGSGEGGFRVRIGDGGIDPESAEFQEAQEACGELLGDFAPGRRMGPGEEAAPDAEAAP